MTGAEARTIALLAQRIVGCRTVSAKAVSWFEMVTTILITRGPPKRSLAPGLVVKSLQYGDELNWRRGESNPYAVACHRKLLIL
jgi:hypothetical protein